MQHGEINNYGNRWCAVCNRAHGVLYVCEHYPPELQAKIEQESDQFERNLNDPEWCRQQIENGIPKESIEILKIFAGEKQ